MPNIGQNIKKIIENSGYKQNVVAEKIGMHPNSLSRKLGEENWSSEVIMSVSKVLNVPVSLIFSEDILMGLAVSTRVSEPETGYGLLEKISTLENRIAELKEDNTALRAAVKSLSK